MEVEKLEKEVAEKQLELKRLKGKYGTCIDCKEEKELYSDGVCWRCDLERQRKYAYEQYKYLVGAKIVDIEVESSRYHPDLYALILDNERRISINPWSDPSSLEVEKFRVSPKGREK